MSIESIKTSLAEFRKTRDFDAFNAQVLESKEKLSDLLQASLDYNDLNSGYVGSWVCSHLVKKDKAIFENIQDQIVIFLEKSTDQGSLRNWMNVLSQIKINEKYHGKIIDMCCSNIENSDNKVALQVYSIYTLIPLLHLYPELYAEIAALIELHSMDKSIAYGAATRKFLNKTKKIR